MRAKTKAKVSRMGLMSFMVSVLAEDLCGELLGGVLCLVARELDEVFAGAEAGVAEADVSGAEHTGSVLADFHCFLSGGAEDGHVVVCLFVVVDIANIQLFFTYPNIHAKKDCPYARK